LRLVFSYDLLFFFSGDSDIEQLGKIFNVLGTPKVSEWEGVDLLPNYMEFESREPMELIQLFGRPRDGSLGKGNLPADLDLILKMLSLNPAKRINAKKVREKTRLLNTFGDFLFFLNNLGIETCLFQSRPTAM
jgi:serine/threonine protein kinase